MDEYPERGVKFNEIKQGIKDITQRDDKALVEASEGIDRLCRACPNCQDERCQSPQGNEEAVRKWDGIILRGLGISYGETRTSNQWRILIEERAPLNFCQTRCQWRSKCSVSHFGYVPTREEA
jgi:hypothetical protein